MGITVIKQRGKESLKLIAQQTVFLKTQAIDVLRHGGIFYDGIQIKWHPTRYHVKVGNLFMRKPAAFFLYNASASCNVKGIR